MLVTFIKVRAEVARSIEEACVTTAVLAWTLL
jgi:hypothetical protein